MAGDMFTSMTLPTVTEDDLRTFHSKHFSGALVPTVFFHGVNEEEYVEEGQAWLEEEEDDLGYYDDGVKRTLTDAQIAIFRHSEIQAFLRQQRQQDLDAAANGSEDGELAEEASHVVAEPSTGSVSTPQSTVNPGPQAQKRGKKWRNKKRKRAQVLDQEYDSEERANRRAAREQDGARGSAMDLDYGDEPGNALSRTNQITRPMLSYEDIDGASIQGPYRGKKESQQKPDVYQWPQLGEQTGLDY